MARGGQEAQGRGLEDGGGGLRDAEPLQALYDPTGLPATQAGLPVGLCAP